MLAWVLVTGCASLGKPLPPPPTPAEIVERSKAGDAPTQIIALLRAARAVYPLTATEIIGLHDQGVDNAVLDYMQTTYLEAVRADERGRFYAYYGGWWPGWPYGPRPYHYWPH